MYFDYNPTSNQTPLPVTQYKNIVSLNGNPIIGRNVSGLLHDVNDRCSLWYCVSCSNS